MNEYCYTYQKLRSEFGRHPNFCDSEIKNLTIPDIPADIMDNLLEKNPRKFVADNIPKKSEHSVNTDRVKTKSLGMSHLEGGWPKEVNAAEYEQTLKWRKRYEKDAQFSDAVKTLCGDMKYFLEQNNAIDLYEDFYPNDQNAPNFVEDISVRTIAVFKDPTEDSRGIKRNATQVVWSPENDKAQVATAYSLMQFQHPGAGTVKKASYIWDVAYPNNPISELLGPSPIVSLQYNSKSPDMMLTGMYNGLVSIFDVRKGTCQSSSVGTSHHDPVYSVCWLHSKTNSEFVSCSTDGQILWWDMRQLSAPLKSCTLTETRNGEDKVVGATCLEWVQEAGPTKYLVGSETGLVFALNRKPKGNTDITSRFGQDSGHHHGPVYSVKRNPFISKYFLTVGDWSARVFAEDSKSPIITSSYHSAMLQTGCWSPTRPGVFMVGRRDGVVDFWDYYYRQNEVACSHKVSDAGIWSMSVRNDGRLMACGDAEGRVTVLDLCPYFYVPYGSANTEKANVTAILDREASREKGLEAARRATGGKAARSVNKKGDDGRAVSPGGLPLDLLSQIEADFFRTIGREPPNAHNDVITPVDDLPPAALESIDYENQPQIQNENSAANNKDSSESP